MVVVVAEFHITPQNAPYYVAFSTTEGKLKEQMEQGRTMMGYFDHNDQFIGYYSLAKVSDLECELNNLCVTPDCRHTGIGAKLLDQAFSQAKELGYEKMNIGIVEENTQLKKWYEEHGFLHTGTKKFDFFPFTCGYMERVLKTE